MTMDHIRESLKNDYEYLNSQNGVNDFIIGLADYVNYIEATPELKSMVDGWLEKKSKIYEDIVSFEEKTVKELENTKIILEKLINSKKGVKEEITKEGLDSDGLTRLNQYLNHDPDFRTSGIPSEVINGYLEEIARDLTEKGHVELLNKFTIAEPGNGRKWEFSKSLKKRWQLSKEFKLQRQTEVWGNWDYIALAPTLVPFLGGFDNKEFLEISDLDPDLWDTYYGFISSIRNKKDIENLIERIKVCATRVYKQLLKELPESNKNVLSPNRLKSIHLVTPHLVKSPSVIFLVLDEQFEIPIRCVVKNKMGKATYINKLYDIAYLVDAPGKKVDYDKNLADSINNGLFKKSRIADYIRTNKLKKPTLVQKSEDKKSLVLEGETLVKTELVGNIPTQYRYLYIDKTR